MEQAFQVEGDETQTPSVEPHVRGGRGSWVTGGRLSGAFPGVCSHLGLEGLLQRLPTLSPTISEARRDLPEVPEHVRNARRTRARALSLIHI